MEEGADVIDIGAESTKPYSQAVDSSTQLKRILLVLDYIAGQKLNIPISIDTRDSIVAKEVLQHGEYIINDVSGGDYDENMFKVVADFNATIILQHSLATPDIMQKSPYYNDLMEDIYFSLLKKINIAKSYGITNIIVDPGIGFGKTKEHNLEILSRIEELKLLNCPIMVGISRKSFLGDYSDNEMRDIMTLAMNSRLIEKGVDYIRVHNVKLHKKFLDNLIKKNS